MNTDVENLQKAEEIQPIKAEDTDIEIDPSLFNFKTTAELEPLDKIIGQKKAMSALQLGLGISQEGYNIYVAGLTGTGKMNTIKKSLQKKLDDSKVPDDWVYVHNFDNPDEPRAINLKPGKGKKLEKDMEKLLERLQESLPKAFRQQDFSEEKEKLSEKYESNFRKQMDELKKKAKKKGFEVSSTPDGRIFFIPVIDGKPAENEEDLDKLSEEERQRILEARRELSREGTKLMQSQRDISQKLSSEIRNIERKFGDNVVRPMIDSLKESYKDNEKIQKYLDQIAEHVLDNLSDFQQKGPKQKQAMQLMGMMGGGQKANKFLEYKVNVIVDNSKAETAPIVIEDAPTYQNLFGSIERTVDQRGRLVTNYTQIKPGSMLRANGGYLVFDLEDALTEPFVYKNLKRTLKSGSIQVESFNPWMPFSAGRIKPEPIPTNTKVIVVGRPIIYYLLRYYDQEFASIFKVKADFGTEMQKSDEHIKDYARFITGLANEEDLKPFTSKAAVEVVRFASKQAAKKDKMLTKFSEVADLLREANYFADEDSEEYVTEEHIRKALENRIYRSNRIAEKIRELIADGTLIVDLEGCKMGQINGLAILDLGDYMFGKPNKVTSSVGMGSEGVINIEREAKLSGGTHDKGVLILSGYLRNKYGRNKPLAVSASIGLEQSYGGVEGDSASSTELFALLSNLAEVPLRQDIAVTGSVNQWGQIQAIGGVNKKIEGFYDTCKAVGFTGKQGVAIPESNVNNLILRHDVRKAVEEGKFHIFPIKTVDEGMELLTGKKAGSPEEENTLHWLIDRQLKKMAKDLRQFGHTPGSKSFTQGQEKQPEPGPPKTPDDQP